MFNSIEYLNYLISEEANDDDELYKIAPEEADEAQDVAAALMEGIRTIVVLLSPFVPHVAEELWKALKRKSGLVRVSWPIYDPDLLIEEEVVMVVQVNGKKRAEIKVAMDAEKDIVQEAALAEPNVQRFVEGKTLRKVVHVPGKLLNLVAS